MYVLNILIYIIIIFCNTTVNMSTTNIEWISSSSNLDHQFVNNVFYSQNPEIPCELLTSDQKLAICNYILESPNLVTQYGSRIYLNGIVFSNMNASCEYSIFSFKHKINYNAQNITGKVFPCYARHEPTRTSNITDDANNYIYISRGTSQTEYYIFRYEKHASQSNDRLILTDYIKNLDINKLKIPSLEDPKYINQEVESLTHTSCNKSVAEIEVNYLREHAFTYIRNSHENLLCNLPVERKILLCKLMLFHADTQLRDIILDENAFNEESAKCVTKHLNFQYYTEQNNFKIPWSHEMFSCYGKLKSNKIKRWYLADGFRNMSILVFIEKEENDGNYNHVQFYEFYENMHIPMKPKKFALFESCFSFLGFNKCD